LACSGFSNISLATSGLLEVEIEFNPENNVLYTKYAIDIGTNSAKTRMTIFRNPLISMVGSPWDRGCLPQCISISLDCPLDWKIQVQSIVLACTPVIHAVDLQFGRICKKWQI
jgi:hypothetical protein